MELVKGHLILWNIKNFKLDKESFEADLAALECPEYAPKNEHKTALRRAVCETLKIEESDKKSLKKFYKRFDDGGRFAVITPQEILDSYNKADLVFDKELIVHLNKTTGALTFDNPSHPIATKIKDEYAIAKQTIDVAQFRQTLLSVLREKCYGIAVRKAGGIYYVATGDLEKFDIIRKIFAKYPENCHLEEIPVFNNEATDKTISAAIVDDILSELQDFKKELDERKANGEKLTSRLLKSRKGDVVELMSKAKHHAGDLKDKVYELDTLLKSVTKVLDSAKDAVTAERPFDLLEAMNQLV